MAIIECPECRHEMSDTANVCPQCGYPYAKNLALYRRARKLMETCKTSDEYLGVAEIFRSVSKILDADEQSDICRRKAQEVCEEIATKARREEEYIQRMQFEKKHEKEQEKEKRKIFLEKNKKRIVVAVICTGVFIAGTATAINVAFPTFKYHQAETLFETGQYEKAITIFQSLKNFHGADAEISAAKYAQATHLRENGKYSEAIDIFANLGDYKDSAQQIKATYYMQGDNKLIDNDYDGASISFNLAGDFEDATQKRVDCFMQEAALYFQSGNKRGAAAAYWLAGDYAKSRSICNLQNLLTAADCGEEYIATINKDNGVSIYSDSDSEKMFVRLPEWNNISKIVTTNDIGKGVAAIDNSGRCWVESDETYGYYDKFALNLKGIKDVALGLDFMVALKSGGTVVGKGIESSDAHNFGQFNFQDWTGVIDIDAGYGFTVGLKSDGTVAFTGNDKWINIDTVSSWTDVISISASACAIAALKSDGTVVAQGRDWITLEKSFPSNLGWNDIVQIDMSEDGIIGLKSDGTVVIKQLNYGGIDVSNWTNMVAVSLGEYTAVGLRSDGSIITSPAYTKTIDTLF